MVVVAVELACLLAQQRVARPVLGERGGEVGLRALVTGVLGRAASSSSL